MLQHKAPYLCITQHHPDGTIKNTAKDSTPVEVFVGRRRLVLNFWTIISERISTINQPILDRTRNYKGRCHGLSADSHDVCK
jgi:hypothetical protein